MAEPDEARARAVLVEMQDRMIRGPHSALGIPAHATPADIRHAFLELTKTFHPVRFGRMSTEIQQLSNEVFLSLRAAHDSLAKPKVRATGPILPANTPTNSIRPTAQQRPMPRNNDSSSQRLVTEPQPAAPQPAASSGSGPVPIHPKPGAQMPPAPTQRTTAATPLARAPSPPPPDRSRTTPSTGVRVTSPLPAAKPTPSPTSPITRTGSNPTLPTADVRELSGVYELMQRGQWNEARSAITALSAKAPASTKYRALLSYTRGREAQLDRRLDEARVELDTALQLDPDLQLAKTALAELFTRRK
jgi:hypothetical protein